MTQSLLGLPLSEALERLGGGGLDRTQETSLPGARNGESCG